MSGLPTPGPWSVVQYGDGDSLVIHADGDWRICFMATPGDSPRALDGIEANARLIAAAPDMLAALAGLHDILNRAESNASGNPEWDSVSKRVNAARAAIAKATGQ